MEAGVPRKALILLLLLLLVLSNGRCNASRSRRKKRRSGGGGVPLPTTNVDDFFPGDLRSGFYTCTHEDAGEQGVCKVLAALDSQIQRLPSTSMVLPSGNASSCKYRDEGGASFHKYATAASVPLTQLVERYRVMHGRCTSREWYHLKDAYERQEGMKGLQCRYIQWSCTFGLGNKIMSLVSTFLLAILSQRVLLIDDGDSAWEKLFCDAFPASRMHAPAGFFLKDDPAPPFESFIRCYDRSQSSSECAPSGIVPIVFSATTGKLEHSFLFDPAAAAATRDVPVLNFRNSNQHFAAGLFLNPALRPILEILFPDRRVFHNLAKFLLHPSDEVWAEIKRVRERHFLPAIRTVGVQLRESKGEYREYYDMAVPRCIRRNAGMCPIEIDDFLESSKNPNPTKSPKSSESPDEYISVYVSSLIGGHARNLRRSLAEMEKATGQRFVIAMQGADGEQIDDLEHQQRALVDMWSLSLSDVLMTSHMSTFGYTAQGLAGIRPLMLKPWPNDPCWWGLSSDPCFHFAPVQATSRPGYIKSCPDLPDTGLQLVEDL